MSALLEIDHISKRYGEVVALSEMTFEVRAGELFGFVGSNGAGQTTTMRIALGVLAADSGEVRWRGAAVDFETRRRIGYMPEERGLYPKMKVHDQLVYLARLHGLDKAPARAAAKLWAERLGVAARRDDPVEKLSLGNQQRVQLAAALVHDPEVLVLDEPITAGPALFADDGEQRLGLVDDAGLATALEPAAERADLELTIVKVPDEQTARQQVRDGELDAALVDGSRVIVESELDPALRAVLESGVTQHAVAGALVERGVDPAVLDAAATEATLQVDAFEPPDPQAAERTGIAFVVVILLYFQLFTFGLTVAMGVVEEKASRVVEVLLATIRPWQLLLGKVLGIGAAGLLQLVVLGAVGLGVGRATGVVTLTSTAVSVFLGSLGWFLLGFLFFAVLYAAAGSLVSRQEELNAVTTPMTLLILLPFFVAIYSVQSPGGGLAQTLAWIPPFSPLLMPLQQASGEAGVGITVLAVGLMLAATAVFTWLGGRVYAGAVLHSGSRVKLRAALSA